MDLLNLFPPDPVALLLPAASAAPPRLCSPDMRDFLRSASFLLLRTYTATPASASVTLHRDAAAAVAPYVLAMSCGLCRNDVAVVQAASTQESASRQTA